MRFVEVDRGFPEPCWLLLSRSGGRPVTKRTQNWLRFLTEQVGERQPGQVFQHSCERYRETNLCCNPAHVTIGDRSSNGRTAHQVRAETGVPWTGARTGPIGPYRSAPWTCHCGWKGNKHSASLHRLRVHGQSGPVPKSLVDQSPT